MRRSASSATGPTGGGSSSARTSSGSRGTRSSSATSTTLGRYYEFFDTLLLPSANEGTPVVAIEALASSRPSSRRASAACRMSVEDGVDGFLVDVGDIDGMVDRLVELAGDPALRAKMGAAGRERVLPRYRVERLIDDIDGLYRELLASRAAARRLLCRAAICWNAANAGFSRPRR